MDSAMNEIADSGLKMRGIREGRYPEEDYPGKYFRPALNARPTTAPVV